VTFFFCSSPSSPSTLDKQKIQEELADIRREISLFSTQTPSYSFRSIRKREVEDSKKAAEECARSFKELSTDTLLQSIPNEIKKNQEEIDKIKRNIATHEDILSELRSHAEQQQAITTLEKEIEKETIQLQELIDDIKPDFDKISVTVGSLDLPCMEELCVEIDGKKKQVAQRLQSINTELSEKHRRVTECSTTIEHCNRNLAQLQQRIGSLDDSRISAVHDEIQNYEKENNVHPVKSMNVDPKELLGHIDEKLIEIEERNVKSPESVIWTIKRLKKMVRVDHL
jgi:DNA repair exonuclease SbcCD ATPase subunit